MAWRRLDLKQRYVEPKEEKKDGVELRVGEEARDADLAAREDGLQFWLTWASGDTFPEAIPLSKTYSPIAMVIFEKHSPLSFTDVQSKAILCLCLIGENN